MKDAALPFFNVCFYELSPDINKEEVWQDAAKNKCWMTHDKEDKWHIGIDYKNPYNLLFALKWSHAYARCKTVKWYAHDNQS